MEQSCTVKECLDNVLKHFAEKCKDAQVIIFNDGHVNVNFMTHPLELLFNDFIMVPIEDYAKLCQLEMI